MQTRWFACGGRKTGGGTRLRRARWDADRHGARPPVRPAERLRQTPAEQSLGQTAKRRRYAEAVVSELELSEPLASSSLFISVGQTEPSGSEAEQVAMSAGMELSLFMSSETVTNS